jgi:hypothetical protein
VTGPGEHDVSLRWLLTPGQAVIEPNGLTVHTENDDANVRIIPALPAGARLQLWHGNADPVRGWYSPENGVKMPAPQLEYTWRGGLPALTATLITPYRSTLPGHTLSLTQSENGRYDIVVRNGASRDCLSLDLSGNGRAWLERTRNGHTSTLHLTPQ